MLLFYVVLLCNYVSSRSPKRCPVHLPAYAIWPKCYGHRVMIPLGVGLHQGSSLSPYLFAMIMDVLACGINDISPWCMLYADDIVLCGTRSEVVENKLEE